MTAQTELDPERQKQAKQYSRIKRRMWLVDTLFSLLYLLLWLSLGWSVSLRQGLESLFSNPWLLVPAFAVVFGGIYYVLNLPLSFYSGFVLPHRFGQSNQTLSGWISDQVKGLLVGAPIGLVLIELLYLALRLAGGWWWLWAAAGILVFSILLVNIAPVLIMPLFNKYIPLGEEHADLADRLIRLAEQAGAHVQGVFKFDMSRRTKSANAALTGLGNTRRIVLGDTLIDEFTPDEIETVLAHELGHHVNKDIPWMIAFSTLTTTLGLFLASRAMEWVISAFGFNGVADVAALPALMIVLGAYNLLLMPAENGFSRWRERLADLYALRATGKSGSFASAFVRLANQNLADVDPEGWVVFLFYSHPPLNERIRTAKAYSGEPGD
jgi:STE24 endopeptidase